MKFRIAFGLDEDLMKIRGSPASAEEEERPGRGKCCRMEPRTRWGLPSWIENLLLGQLTPGQKSCWLAVLLLMLLLVPGIDYRIGREDFHINLYSFPVILSIFLFGRAGLLSIIILLSIYHVVQTALGLEGRAVLFNNLAQFLLTLVVGLICTSLVNAYRALYTRKAELAESRNELLMNLTHELRSPLFAIRGIVKNLSRNIDKLSTEEVREKLNDAQAAIASINKDVEGLSQVFRVDLNKLEPHLENVPARKLIDGVLNRHQPEFHPGHKLVAEVEKELLVYCDPLLTQQLLDNLVTNSLRHTTGGTVILGATEAGEEIKLTVSDEGPGVPPEDRERIFLRYDRGSRLSGEAGFGVGLYLVKIYCKAQGGRVEIEDPAKGSRFAVFLKKGTEDS